MKKFNKINRTFKTSKVFASTLLFVLVLSAICDVTGESSSQHNPLNTSAYFIISVHVIRMNVLSWVRDSNNQHRRKRRITTVKEKLWNSRFIDIRKIFFYETHKILSELRKFLGTVWLLSGFVPLSRSSLSFLLGFVKKSEF